MTGPQILLVAALLLSLVGVAYAFYDHGFENGKRAHQCADELAMVADAKGRHPSRCQECG